MRQADTAAPRAAAASAAPAQPEGTYDFNQGWLFGGRYVSGSAEPGYDDSRFTEVTLPHTVTPLSWGDWDPAAWQDLWIYRKHFSGRGLSGRVLAGFDGVMTDARVIVGGVQVAAHRGGYLPWSAELTGHLSGGDNVLAVIVDSRWLDVPPDGAPGGSAAVDFLQPGGIYRDVTLRAVPDVFISDVFAKPADVLSPARAVGVQVTIDAARVPGAPVRVTAELRDGARSLAGAEDTVTISGTGCTVARLRITGIPDVTLWSPEEPKLYTVHTTVSFPGGQPHTTQVRAGFREAAFRADGFYLNGQRRKIFGLNRHQLFPYTGMAAAARVQRRDAEILRNELNCTMVRCSHYPQSPHFLDACDELGLMVWEEPPGWQYIGGADFRDIVLQNTRDMVIRDRNRPSVIVWATRLNETRDFPALYRQTRQIACDLDGSRQTTGAMDRRSVRHWDQDVFGYDDYHSSRGDATLKPPLPGVPYLVSEAVGALAGAPLYRWVDTQAVLAGQARMHAQVHAAARSDSRYGGLLAWCGFDYASLNGGHRIWHAVKWPGVTDTFRVPKPGAALYRSQRDPAARPVIVPVFFWDFGPSSPPGGPGPGAMIATNCDRLEVYVGGRHVATGTSDTSEFGGLAYPPVFVDLAVDGSALPGLRIDGYTGRRRVATVRMSADTSRDRLMLTADDPAIAADGTDTTRLTFRAVDAYGNQRPYVSGDVVLAMTGPGTLVGDNPFPFGAYGGVGGAFVRSLPGQAGAVTVSARHRDLGTATARIEVTQPSGRRFR